MSTYTVSPGHLQRHNNEESWEYIDPGPVNQLLEISEPHFRSSVNIKEEDEGEEEAEEEDENSAYQQFGSLQRPCSPTIGQEHQTQREYESAKLLHGRRSDIEDWCGEFLAAYMQAKRYNLPEVRGFRPHRDFVQAISHIAPSYSDVLTLEILEAEETWNRHPNQAIPQKFEIPTMLRNFLNYHRTIRSKRAGSQIGAITGKSKHEESPNSNKRGRTQAKPKKPCLCGDSHFWGQCPYIDASQRLEGFVEDPEKAKKISDYESKDKKGVLNKIRERNRGYKKLRTGSPDQETEPDSTVAGAGDDTTEHTSHPPYFAGSSAFNRGSPGQSNPLLHSWLLSSATNIHVCNNATEFVWKAPAAPDDVVFAGASEVRIEAWGEVEIPLTTTDGNKFTTLKRVALIPSFFTSLVSLGRLYLSNVHFDSGKSILYRGGNPPEHIANLSEVGGQWFLVHRTEPPSSTKELVIIES